MTRLPAELPFATGTHRRQPRISGLTRVALCATLLLTVGGSVRAGTRTYVEVWLVPGLTADVLRVPQIAEVLEGASLALMNCAVTGGYSVTAQMLTLSLGSRQVALPGDSELRLLTESTPEGCVPLVFERRTLTNPLRYAQPPVAVHLGIGSLQRRGLASRLLGEALRRGLPETPGIYFQPASERAMGLLAVRGDGIVPSVSALDAPITVQQVPLRELASRLRRHAMPSRLLILGYPSHSETPAPGRLALAALFDASSEPGLLTSATTRTPGLIANVDIAPSLLRWAGVAESAHGDGRPVRKAQARRPIETLLRLDTLTQLNRKALLPMFLTLGITVLAAGALVLTVGERAPMLSRLCAFVLLALMTMPVALMLSTLASPATTAALMAASTAIMAGLAALSLLARRGRWSTAPLVVAWLTLGTITVDTLLGQPMGKTSLLSSGLLDGMRFYGIGNELMGVLVGFAVLAICLARLQLLPALCLGIAVALLLGSPWHGANAGGLVTATVACGAAVLTRSGRRVRAGAFLGLALLGFLGVLVLALVDSVAGGTSHLGSTLAAAHERGSAHLAEILWRKAQMNLRILLHPWMMTACLAIGAVVFAPRLGLAARTRRIAAAYPDWGSALPAILWGGLAALLFNDSGAIAASFLTGAWLVAGGILLVELNLKSDTTEAAAERPQSHQN